MLAPTAQRLNRRRHFLRPLISRISRHSRDTNNNNTIKNEEGLNQTHIKGANLPYNESPSELFATAESPVGSIR